MTRRRLQVKMVDGRMSVGYERQPHEVIGMCFCGKPVWAAPGQSITWLTRKKIVFGEVVGEEKLPTHKACRKAARRKA